MRRSIAVLLCVFCVLEFAGGSAHADQLPAAPWASAHGGTAPPAPAFLDTSDRRIKEQRPPPAPEQVKALRELEAEVGRFRAQGGAYRDTLKSLLKREYDRQRHEREEGFNGQIKFEEDLEDKARLDAIALFERFIAKYPADPTYTADAMFRLGELYFERDAIAQQEEMNAYLAERDRRIAIGQSLDGLVEPGKQYTATIALYQRLVQQFPKYDKADGVYYLIGYCHNEMSEFDLARMAWLNLVCANHFTYTGTLPESEQKPAGDPRAAEHPALTMGGQPTAPAGAYVDPYEGCEQVVAESKFWSETWLRIGEYHFDLDFGPHGLDKAISAYSKVLARPE
ncbi:MAG TPA: tetratricopeptide repeat protein, partial [Polyangiales bacterium]|nr:tetratricopeptide repeat protein [Polyangiales bacterium]